MTDTRQNVRGRKQSLWNYILEHEIQSGTQFLVTSEGSLYAVLGSTGQVLQLPRAGRGGDRWFSYFQTLYGLSEREDQTKFIYDVLRHYVYEHGTKVELRRFAAYSHETQTTYISAYDGRMFRVAGSDDVQTLPCGEDGVFFADDDNGVHCTPDIGNHGILLDKLTDLHFAASGLSGITPEQQKMALIIWIFSLAFPDLMPTKPILLLEGTKGSGKTSAVVLLQLALMGISRPMILQRNKEDDFGVVLLRSPIALFDNTDSYIEWVPDAICAYCTAGVWTKRRLYTDDESMTIKPHAFIAIATRNPASFRRDDVADRCVILRLDRREAFTSFQQLQQGILDDRPRLFGEYLWYVGRIIEEIRADTLAGNVAGDSTHRMADFAALGSIVGRVLGWEPESVADLMLALQGERDAFVNEEDPLVDLLQKWVGYKSRVGPGNVGRLVQVFQLHAELETLAQAHSIQWKDSARSLAQKLRSTHIEREFRVEQVNAGGHKSYRFWRHSDTKLTMVE